MARSSVDSPAAFLETLCRVTNEHDLDGIVKMFASDYRNETPVHPARAFVGADQVRANWERILTFVPDVQAEILRSSIDGDVVWSEWEHRGTRPDGSAHVMRGPIIFGVVDGRATWARFYLEPVDDDPADVDHAVGRQVLDGSLRSGPVATETSA